MSPVTHLPTSLHLSDALPLAQLSVVLFTSPWSLDSLDALTSLHCVASSFPHSSLPPYIAFYTVPFPTPHVHPPPPLPPYPIPLHSHSRSRAHQKAALAFNATRDLPWFPSLRIFPPLARGPTPSSHALTTKFTHTDSFTPPAIHAYILATANAIIPPNTPSHRALTPLTSPAPAELSPDALSTLLSPPSPTPLALLLLPGGASAITHFHMPLWLALSTAVPPLSLSLSVLDTSRYPQFAARHGAPPSSPSPVLLLLSPASNKSSITLSPTPLTARAILHRFHAAPPGHPPPLPPAPRQAPGTVPGAAVRAAVAAAVARRRDVWLVVHDASCGFSQRASAVVRAFGNARPAVQVVLVVDVERLPEEIDRLVDGFPTILRPVGGTCAAGRCQFAEYDGPVSVEGMVAAGEGG